MSCWECSAPNGKPHEPGCSLSDEVVGMLGKKKDTVTNKDRPHRFYDNNLCVVCGVHTSNAGNPCKERFEVVSLYAAALDREAGLREALEVEVKAAEKAHATSAALRAALIDYKRFFDERQAGQGSYHPSEAAADAALATKDGSEYVDALKQERDEALHLFHVLAAQAHEVIAGKVPPEYVPQALSIEMLQHLLAAGMGKPGAKYGNTLWACIHEAVDIVNAAAVMAKVLDELRLERHLLDVVGDQRVDSALAAYEKARKS
jgi:hypothetical protein